MSPNTIVKTQKNKPYLNKADRDLSSSSQALSICETEPVSELEYDLDMNEADVALPCLGEYRATDSKSGVVFRDGLIDYTTCAVKNCIRNLV